MELDLSLIEIDGEDDDSLLRLEDPCDGTFPCSPVHEPRSTHAVTAPHSSSVGGVRTVQFNENSGGRSSKENVDVYMDGTRLNMDPQQMKRTKKAKGYNMRKSLAWNKAFFTEEGVLDPEELSLVTGTFNSSKSEPLSVIQEKRKPGKIGSPHFQSPKEKQTIKSPGLRRGLSPRCESSARHRASPAKEIGSPHVRRLVLSAQDIHIKGEKYNGCPRPKPSPSYKRPASTSALSATSKEPKLTKSSIPRAERCTLPTVPRSALPKPGCSSRITRTEPKQVPSSPKTVAAGGKGYLANTKPVRGSMVRTRGVKDSATNKGGFNGNAKSASCPKSSSSKETEKLHALNNTKLPPKAHTPRDPQVSKVFGFPNQVHLPDRVSNRHNNIPLPQKCSPVDSQKQVSHVQVGKPTGLRVPSPSLGFFGLHKQSASLGDSRVSNTAENSSYYTSVRNLDVAQRPLQAPEIVPRVSNGDLETHIIESLSTMTSTSLQDVQADIREECPQTRSHDFDRNGLQPSKSDRCDERSGGRALNNDDNLQNISKICFEVLNCDVNQGKADNSCREEALSILSREDFSVSEAVMQGCGDNQQLAYSNQRSVYGSEQLSGEGSERMNNDCRKQQMTGCKKSIGEQMDHDASSPNHKCGENEGLVTAARKEELKEGLSLEDYNFSAAETKGSGDHSQSIKQDKQKSLDCRDLPSLERAETSQPDSSEAHQETYTDKLDGCAYYDPSVQDEPTVVDIKVHRCVTETDSLKDRILSEHESTDCLNHFKTFTTVAEGDIVKDINNKVNPTSHVFPPGLGNVSCLGMLNRNNSRSSYLITEETFFGVSEPVALENEPNSPGNFRLTTCNLDGLQRPDNPRQDNATSSSYLNDDHSSSSVGAEVSAVNKIPSPESQPESERLVEDRHQKVSDREFRPQMSSMYDLVEISNTDFDEMKNKAVLLNSQDDEIMLQQSSNQVTEIYGAGTDVYNKEFQSIESKNHLDLVLLDSKSVLNHKKDCNLGVNNESSTVDGNDKSSSEHGALEETNVVCKADAFTYKYSPSETCHLDVLEDQFDMPDSALDVPLQKQSSDLSNNLDVGELERNFSETFSAQTGSISKVAVEQLHADASTDLGGNGGQHHGNSIVSNPMTKCVIMKPPPDVVPFSDEWLAAIEAAGEDILTLKSGAVQHSPTEKPLPEPSPWSPVKRNKNQGLGPFDCTKHTIVTAQPADE